VIKNYGLAFILINALLIRIKSLARVSILLIMKLSIPLYYATIFRNLKNLIFNVLNTELSPIYHFLALLGTHPIFHVSRVRVNFGVRGFRANV
jgi:hypothetical protein